MVDFYSALSGMDGGTRKARIRELLGLVGLEQWGDVRLGKYSKGMLQRIGLAQALMHSPSLLILDEPGDGVDPVGRRQIRDILHSLEEKGVTIFLNSHLLSEVELFCRDVAIIHKGKLALEGRIADLTATGGYRVETEQPPDRLIDELRSLAGATVSQNGVTEFHFSTREAANRGVDLLRAGNCEIEAMVRTRSTLEEVFLRTVDGK